jgi:excisionase family DNA binding protein
MIMKNELKDSMKQTIFNTDPYSQEHDPNDFEALLDSAQAASFLKIHPKTLQRLARKGEVPAIQIGKLWRFRKSALDSWLQSEVLWSHQPHRATRQEKNC